MPGIAGLITKKMPPEQAKRQLQRMLSTLRHESFYTCGTWTDPSCGVYVGWTALASSFSDGMPLFNEQRDIALVFSGEEFSESGISQRLQERGHQLDTRGPSYLVHLSEEDPSFPASLNGRFHGLLTNSATGSTLLFNDRYGMQRIYCHEAQDAFYFAAEAKAILAVRPELRSLDPRGLGELIACGCTLENKSIFKGIEALPPASAWSFRNGLLDRKDFYFHSREWEEQPQLDPESYYQQLQEVFTRNLPRYFEGPQPIALSLTGGLDTRMILARRKFPEGSLPCYTFGGMYRDCQDVRVGRRVARACGQTHQVIPVAGDFLSRFAHYAERAIFLSDGCVDVERASDLYANEKARQIAPVRMTGNYGGEVLRRIRAFRPGDPLPGLFSPEVMSNVARAKQTYASLLHGHPLSFAVFRQAPWHHYGLLALEQTQLSLRSPYLDNEFVRTVFRAPDSSCRNDDACIRLISEGNPALWRIPTDRGIAGGQGRLRRSLIRGFIEFTVKAEYAYDYGMPQWVAGVDHLLAPLHLERLFLGRHKFAHYRVWYRDALSSYVREMLLDPRSLSRPYLDKKMVESVVQGHLHGNRNHTVEIHKLLTLELIHRFFVDSI
ncbi:MAG: hypothetical protein LAN71_00495 [Acidobacteriia bacterium]|nr:hypothetical protein [Terriglobia bacterium]